MRITESQLRHVVRKLMAEQFRPRGRPEWNSTFDRLEDEDEKRQELLQHTDDEDDWQNAQLAGSDGSCPVCKGSGEDGAEYCENCGGTGLE